MVSYYPEHKGHDFEVVHCRKPNHQLALPNITELDAFSGNVASAGETCILQQHLTAAESAWICIRNAMESDLTLAQVGLEHMVKLKNHLTTLLNKKETPRLQLSSQTSEGQLLNNSKSKRTSVRSSNKRPVYEPRLIAPKPALLGTNCILKLSDGSEHQAPFPTDYTGTSRVINVEHSYVATIQLL